MDSEGRGVERFQGSFCSLFCSYHLMVVATADPICTSSPILPISQPASFPSFPTSHRIACMKPTPFSPSPLTASLHSTRIFRRQMFFTCPDATCILEREEAVESLYRDDALDSGVRDERCGEGEGYDIGRRVHMV